MKNTSNIFRNLLLAVSLLLGVIGSPEKAKAQVHLSVSGGLVNPNDTIYEYDTVLLKFVIKNTGTSPFSGSFFLDAFLQDSLLQAMIPLDSAFIQNFYIGAGDSIPLYFPWIIHTQTTNPQGPLRIGNNPIVVWPTRYTDSITSTVLFTHDTLGLDLRIDSVTTGSGGDNPRIPPPNVYFVYDVQSQLLQMLPPPDKLEIRSVSVCEATGRVIYSHEGHPGYINVDNWRSGIYFVSIDFGNGTRKSYKVLIAN